MPRATPKRHKRSPEKLLRGFLAMRTNWILFGNYVSHLLVAVSLLEAEV